MHTLLKLSLFVTFFIGFLQSQSFAFGTEKNGDEQDIIANAERKYLSAGSPEKLYRYYHDETVEEGREIDGHLMVIKGNLAVHGKIDGDVLVVWGNVKVYNTGYVDGNITSVGGKVDVYDNGVVRGGMLETNIKNLVGKDRTASRIFRKSLIKDRYGTIPVHRDAENVVFKYNRVEGTFLGLQLPKQYIPDIGHFSLYGFLGYGFGSEKTRFQLGLDRWFLSPFRYRMELGAEVHSLTDTKDLWRIPYTENTLAALFFREDFLNYFQREGFSFHISQNLSQYLLGRVEYRNDDYASLTNSVSWSLFGGDKIFRPNPSLGNFTGNMRSVYGELYLDSRDNLNFTTTGWYARLSSEVSSSALGGDFSFNRYLVDIRHYQPIATGENVNFRLMLGTSQGTLPVQRSFDVGGISTLRGFRWDEFSGNAMFLLNAEYRIHSRILGSELPLLGEYFSLILFTDLGNAWRGAADENAVERLNGLTLRTLKNDVGFAIADPRGDYRLNVAKRTDSSGGGFVLTFRVSQPF